MKKSSIIILLLFIGPISLWSQIKESRELPSFNKIIVSPLIDLILINGSSENVTLESTNESLDQVSAVVKGQSLRIFLKGARILARKKRKNRRDEAHVLFERPGYDQSSRVTAYVTYVQLAGIQVRGQNRITVRGKLTADRFKLKAFGSTDIHFDYMDVGQLKVALYGDHKVVIDSGQVQKQVYLAYGDNRVNVTTLEGISARTSLYGDNQISMNVAEIIKVSSLGEADIYYKPGPKIQKGLVIGDTNIRRIR